MDRIIRYLCCIIVAIGVCSCNSGNELISFSKDTSYIYFNTGIDSDTGEALDSIEYSFAYENKDVSKYTFNIPVAISGFVSEKDRSYKVEFLSKKSNVSDADWDKTTIQDLKVEKGMMFDTIKLVVNRNIALKDGKKHIVIQIKANDNFKEGREDLLTVKLIFSDILLKPVWWDDWDDVFGPFYAETLLKWKEIYYKGVDPNYPKSYYNVSGSKEEPYYWDNMVMGYYAGKPSYVPSTFMFVPMLKEYFDKNVVYGTNEDGSKTRILINY